MLGNISSKNDSSVPLKCQRCGKEWNYTGRNPFAATCPFCCTRVWISKNRVDLQSKPVKKERQLADKKPLESASSNE